MYSYYQSANVIIEEIFFKSLKCSNADSSLWGFFIFMENRDFKGVWIPKILWLNKDLSMTEKLLLIEISSLDNSNKGCFKSNKNLAEFIGISEGRCANIISGLKKKNLVYQCFFDGRIRGLKINKESEIGKYL